MDTTTIRFAALDVTTTLADLAEALKALAHEESRGSTPDEIARALQAARVASRLLTRQARLVEDALFLPR